MHSLKKNITYNFIYQLLIMILPFITAPYLSRVIGADGVGTYSYSYSVAQYFVYLAMLGLTNYGNRAIASCGDDRDKRSKTFCEIYSMQVITALCSLALYFLYVTFFEQSVAAFLQGLYVLSALFDINWFFFGTENFKLTVVRNTIIKITTVVLIFVFVRTSDDVSIYILIMAAGTLASQLALWPFVKKFADIKIPKWKDVKKHFKPNLLLFIPVIAVSIYKVMDKVMLGQMASTTSVGYYEYAEKIYNIPLLLVTAVGTVMLPRTTNLYAQGNDRDASKYFDLSMELILAFANAAMFGLMAISEVFITLYYGDSFAPSAQILNYLAVTIVFLSAGNVIRTQYLIPKKLDKIYTRSAIYGAISNFIVNFILIPRYESVGAAIGTIVAEVLVFSYQVFKIRDSINLKKIAFTELSYFVAGFLMYVVIINLTLQGKVITLFVRILVGVLIYGIVFFLIIYKHYRISPVTVLKRLLKGKITN